MESVPAEQLVDVLHVALEDEHGAAAAGGSRRLDVCRVTVTLDHQAHQTLPSPEYRWEALDGDELDKQQIRQTGSRLSRLTVVDQGAFLLIAEEQDL